MYESFFEFDERPFNAVPLAHRYYPATAIEDARERLTRSIDRDEGPGLLIGPAGTGKSLLLHVLAEQFGNMLAVVHLGSGRICSRRTLLQTILFELGLPYRDMQEGELRLSLLKHLASEGPCPDGMLLLVDEAHALPLALLEELRTITDLVCDGRARARLVLAGSAALEESFANPKLESFNQRLAVRCYLQALDHNDTVQYVRAQIAASDGDPEQIFTTEALDTIHRATDGIPRLVNQLCDHVLVMASAGGVRQLSAIHIEEAWADLQQLPTPWSVSGTTAESPPQTDVVEFGSLDDEASPSESTDALEADVEAVPFPVAATAADADGGPEETLDVISEQLSALDEPFEPAGSIGPEIELVFHDAHDPFADSFDEEEEVVIGCYTSLEETLPGTRQRVRSFEGDEIPDAIEQATDRENEPSSVSAHFTPDADPVMPEDNFAMQTGHGTTAATQTSPGGADFNVVISEDHELVIIEDEPVTPPPAEPAKVQRQNYRQLFANLRRG